MIVVAILGILAAVAIPAFLNYIQRAKTAEVPPLFKSIVDGEAAFFQRPRQNTATLQDADPCILITQSSHADYTTNMSQKRAWDASPGLNAIGVASSPSYYVYQVASGDVTAVTAVPFGNDTTGAAGGLCGISATGVVDEATSAAAAANIRVVNAVATGDLDNDTTLARFTRRFTLDGANLSAGALGYINELE